MYFLVQLRDGGDKPRDEFPDHEPFVDGLIARNQTLVGGHFPDPPHPGVFAAYVLRCSGLEDANAIVAEDPYVAGGLATASIVRWEIVAINPAAIDPAVVVRPEDVAPRGS